MESQNLRSLVFLSDKIRYEYRHTFYEFNSIQLAISKHILGTFAHICTLALVSNQGICKIFNHNELLIFHNYIYQSGLSTPPRVTARANKNQKREQTLSQGALQFLPCFCMFLFSRTNQGDWIQKQNVFYSLSTRSISALPYCRQLNMQSD